MNFGKIGWGAALVGGLVGLGSCTLLLGDDYRVGSDGTGGTGTGGGHTGGGGSGGGITVAPLDCAWDPMRFVVAKDLKGEPVDRLWNNSIMASLAKDRLRVIATRSSPNGTIAEVYSVEKTSGNVATFTFQATRLLDFKRVGGNGVALLYTKPTAGAPIEQIVLRYFADDDTTGAASVEVTLAALASGEWADQGRFVHLTGGAQNDGVFALSVTDPTGTKTVVGIYTGTITQLQQFTEYDFSLADDSFKPVDVVRNGNDTIVFVGAPGTSDRAREYVLPDGPITPMPPTVTFDTGYYPLGVSQQTGGPEYNVAFGFLPGTGIDIELRTGQLDPADLAMFDPLSLPVAYTFPSFTDVPTRGEPRWFGPNLVWAGRYEGDQGLLGLVIAHESGALRTETSLPIPGVLPDYLIDEAAAAPDPVLATLGGDLGIAWLELHNDGTSYHVLNTGVLRCLPP